MTQEQIVVLWTLVVYKLVLLAMGFIAQRRTSDETDFYLGGRQLGPLVAAISASASSSSAWTLLGVSGAAWASGLSALWVFPGCVGGFALNWFVVARPLSRYGRENDCVTVTDVLAGPRGTPGGQAVRRVASTILLLALGAYVASQFNAAGILFETQFELDRMTSVLIGAAVMLLYVVLGGFWAVSLTDTLQGLVMAVTAVCVPVAAFVAVGGPGGLADGIRSVSESAPEFASVVKGAGPVAALGLVLGYLGIGLGYPGQPHVVNRFMALREGKDALRQARRYAMIWAVVTYSGMILLGLCGRILYESLGNNEIVLLVATRELFPPVVTGIMSAAVLSAMMSTTDSQLLVGASAVTHDLGDDAGDPKRMLLHSRVVVTALTTGAAFVALTVDTKIFDQVLSAWAAMGAAFGPPLLVIILGGRPGRGRIVAAMLAGSLLAVLFNWQRDLWPEMSGALRQVVPYLVSLAIVLLPGDRRASR